MGIFSSEKRKQRDERASQAQPCSQAIVDLASESWRLEQNVKRAVVHMDPMDAERFLNQFEWYRRKVRAVLDEAGLRVVDITGEIYQTGMAATPINLEDFSDRPEAGYRVARMTEPIVMENGQVRKTGTVWLEEVPEEERIQAQPDED